MANHHGGARTHASPQKSLRRQEWRRGTQECVRHKQITRLMRTFIFLALLTFLAPAAELYNEQYRPQFHFSPERNWTNDPCGLIYANGEYHLFFQFNPFGDVWGHMSWGHAVSPDLVHWKQQP